MVGLALEMDAGEFYMLVGVLVKCFDWGGNQTGKQKIQNIVEANSRRTVADIEQAASRDCIRVDSAFGLQLRPARNKAGIPVLETSLTHSTIHTKQHFLPRRLFILASIQYGQMKLSSQKLLYGGHVTVVGWNP